MLPMARESEEVQDAVLRVLRHAGEAGLTPDELATRCGDSMRQMRRCGFGSMRELLNGMAHRGVAWRGSGPTVTYYLSVQPGEAQPAAPAAAAATPLATVLKTLSPSVSDATYLFASIPAAHEALLSGGLLQHVVSFHREAEGLSLVVDAAQAQLLPEGAVTAFPSKMITLRLATSLDLVGLTAHIGQLFTQHSMPCNVVAGYHHDHLFVPSDRADEALAILKRL